MMANLVTKGVALLIVVSLALPTSLVCARHRGNRAVKKGILLVAFGSTVPEAQVSFKNIDDAVKKAFPGVPVYWAYTSRIVVRKMAEEGKHLFTPEEALATMMRKDYTHIAVQSIHTIPGEEFHGLVENAHRFARMDKGPRSVLVGYPLLATSEDMEQAAEAILEVLPRERRKDEAVVLVGHGSHHPADVYYAALAYRLQKSDPNVFVGTVEGWPGLDDVKAELKKKGIRKAYLMPFMSVAGDHARNDIAGSGADSWKSVLEKEGISCVPVLKGTAEYQSFVEIWLDHLQQAFSHFH